MKVAIVDTEYTGHHFEYMYGLCSQLKHREAPNLTVDLFCHKKIKAYVSENKLPSLEDIEGLRVRPNDLPYIHSPQEWQKKQAYRTIKKLSNFDQIIFLHINLYLFALSFYGLMNKNRMTVKGIYFNSFVRRKANAANELRALNLRYLCTRYDTSIYVLNDQEAVQKLNDRCNTRAFEVISDPIATFYYQTTLPKPIELSRQRYTFTMLGTLSRRKGIFEFLQAIEQSESGHKFVFAGRVEDGILGRLIKKVNRLADKGFTIELENNFLPNRYFAHLIDQSDIIVLPYLTKGASSGLLGHAAYRNKAVLGPDSGILSDIINKFNLGATTDPRDVKQFANLLDHPKQILARCKTESIKKYVAQNSYHRFFDKLILN